MKKLLAYFLAIALVSCSSKESESQSNSSNAPMPSFDEVVFKLYSEYNITENLGEQENVSIYKSPKGWEVVKTKFNTQRLKDDELSRETFWDASSGQYKGLDWGLNDQVRLMLYR